MYHLPVFTYRDALRCVCLNSAKAAKETASPIFDFQLPGNLLCARPNAQDPKCSRPEDCPLPRDVLLNFAAEHLARVILRYTGLQFV